MFITQGLPEVYKTSCGSIAKVIASGPGGQENAILSINPSSLTATFEVSIWLNLFGMTCVGGGYFESSLDAAQFGIEGHDIVWHSTGDNMCVISNGDVFFITIVWTENCSANDITFHEATNICNAAEHLPFSRGDQISVRLKSICRHSVLATSICASDSGRFLLIGSKDGTIYRFSWKGVLIGEIPTEISHDGFKTWQKISPFMLTESLGRENREISSAKFVKCTVENEQDHTSEGLPVVIGSRISKISKDNSNDIDDSNRNYSRIIKNCFYSNVMNFSLILKTDGSISFLKNNQNNPEKMPKTKIRDSILYDNIQPYQLCSKNLKPIMVLKFETAYRKEGGIYKKQDSYLLSNLILDNHHNDVDKNLQNGNYQTTIGKIINICIIENSENLYQIPSPSSPSPLSSSNPFRSSSINEINTTKTQGRNSYPSIILAMTTLTSHSLALGIHKEKNGTDGKYDRFMSEKETLTLSLVRVSLRSNDDNVDNINDNDHDYDDNNNSNSNGNINNVSSRNVNKNNNNNSSSSNKIIYEDVKNKDKYVRSPSQDVVHLEPLSAVCLYVYQSTPCNGNSNRSDLNSKIDEGNNQSSSYNSYNDKQNKKDHISSVLKRSNNIKLLDIGLKQNFILVTFDNIITCRFIQSLGCELFQINTSILSPRKSLKSVPNRNNDIDGNNNINNNDDNDNNNSNNNSNCNSYHNSNNDNDKKILFREEGSNSVGNQTSLCDSSRSRENQYY